MVSRMNSATSSIRGSIAGSSALKSGLALGSLVIPIARRICAWFAGVSAPRMTAPSFTR
jgi:hypothetical protein